MEPLLDGAFLENAIGPLVVAWGVALAGLQVGLVSGLLLGARIAAWLERRSSSNNRPRESNVEPAKSSLSSDVLGLPALAVPVGLLCFIPLSLPWLAVIVYAMGGIPAEVPDTTRLISTTVLWAALWAWAGTILFFPIGLLFGGRRAPSA